MEGDGEKADGAENNDGSIGDNTQKQPPEVRREGDIPPSPAPYRSVITIELASTRKTVQVTGEESCSVLDSAETIDPTDLLESNMEVDEDNIGMEHPYLNNVHSKNDTVILKCSECDFIALDSEELTIHRKRFHTTPANSGHTPGAGHLNKESRYTAIFFC